VEDVELESCSPAQGTEESGVELGDGRIFVMVEELFPDVAAWFDALCFSYEVMSTKPEPRAFLATLERLNVTPEQCVFVDDAEQNVQGARAVGIDAVRFVSAQKLASSLQERQLV